VTVGRPSELGSTRDHVGQPEKRGSKIVSSGSRKRLLEDKGRAGDLHDVQQDRIFLDRLDSLDLVLARILHTQPVPEDLLLKPAGLNLPTVRDPGGDMLAEEDGTVCDVLEMLWVVCVGRVDGRIQLTGKREATSFVLKGREGRIV
jgi:hypothetical protein